MCKDKKSTLPVPNAGPCFEYSVEVSRCGFVATLDQSQKAEKVLHLIKARRPRSTTTPGAGSSDPISARVVYKLPSISTIVGVHLF